MSDSAPRWQHLINTALSLEEAAEGRGKVKRAYLLRNLDSALELFPGKLDPVDDFEAYAVRRMLLAVRRAVAGS